MVRGVLANFFTLKISVDISYPRIFEYWKLAIPTKWSKSSQAAPWVHTMSPCRPLGRKSLDISNTVYIKKVPRCEGKGSDESWRSSVLSWISISCPLATLTAAFSLQNIRCVFKFKQGLIWGARIAPLRLGRGIQADQWITMTASAFTFKNRLG